MNLIALHGFLGSGKDFSPLIERAKPDKHWTPDLFGKDKFLLADGFAPFVEKACEEIDRIFPADAPLNMIGYSLGGRLALHLLLENPRRFQKVILLSVHPGLFELSQQKERRLWEKEWINKLSRLSLKEFEKEWLSQEIFHEDPERRIPWPELDREALKKSFDLFSNTKHLFTEDKLHALSKKLIWVFGEKDLKFMRLKAALEKKRPQDEFHVLSGRGHRLIAGKDLTWLCDHFFG